MLFISPVATLLALQVVFQAYFNANGIFGAPAWA